MALIGLVALVVIGPERLPTVMGQIGRWYRQLRTMSNELLSEARQQWEEGMREVQTISDTVNSAINDAATSQPNLPPPPLRQVPTPLEQARTAADAGPFVLPAWHNRPSPDVEPQGEVVAAAAAPTLLPRALPSAYGAAADDIGVPSLMGPAATEDELAAMAYELPPEDGQDQESADAIRERTIVDLYLNGGITLESATQFLGVSADDFLAWVEFARSLDRSGSDGAAPSAA